MRTGRITSLVRHTLIRVDLIRFEPGSQDSLLD